MRWGGVVMSGVVGWCMVRRRVGWVGVVWF